MKDAETIFKQLVEQSNRPIKPDFMAHSIHQYADNGLYSQQGEAGIINEALKRMNIPHGISVEFGAPTREYCSNTLHLEEKGWICYFFDENPSDPFVMLKRITPENINTLPDCQVMSIDCDGPDYDLWAAYNGKPDIVVIEINSSLDPERDYYSPDKGCNFSWMNKLAELKGYFLLCHTGNNIYVLNKYKELFPDADITFNRRWL